MRLPFLLTVWCQNGGVVVVDDASMAKMSGSAVDVEPAMAIEDESSSCSAGPGGST